jgi:uncharacterized protein (DUF486 family)
VLALSPKVAPIVLLTLSNVFMTFAWYGHLRHRGAALGLVILLSWMIALPEYALAVPANRIGAAAYSPAQLKTIQECITLVVFAGFSVFYLGEPLKLSTVAGFALIALGAGVVFLGK